MNDTELDRREFLKKSAIVPTGFAGWARREGEGGYQPQPRVTSTARVAEFPLTHVERSPDEQTTDAPAVILLHGLGGDEHDLLPHADDLPDDLHVLSVRAPHSTSGDGYAWKASGREPFARSVELLAEFTERVPEAYDVDPERIGLFGFSQGAKAALVSLVEEPELFDWAVALNGYLPRSHNDADVISRAQGKSAFVGVGEEDTVIPPEYGEETADRLADAGLDVTFRSYPVGHRIADTAVEDVAEWLRSRR